MDLPQPDGLQRGQWGGVAEMAEGGVQRPQAAPGGGRDLVQQGLAWQSGWFHTWTLNLLARDPEDAAGNAELVKIAADLCAKYDARPATVAEAREALAIRTA